MRPSSPPALPALLLLLAACGPDIWDEPETEVGAMHDEDLLGESTVSDEGMYVPPEHREDGAAGATFDAEAAAATFDGFTEAFEELYCTLLYECGYGITVSQCTSYFADYWDEECEAYPADWGLECLELLHEQGCEGLEDGSTMLACQPVQDACSSAIP